jgi:hypothetical protein
MQSTGIVETRALLRGMGHRAGDLRPVWPVIGDAVAGEASRLFKTSGASGGRPWAPLSPAYRRAKIRAGFDERILIRTGAMMRSLTSRPMNIEEYAATWAEFGTRDPKLHFHEDGTKRMPRRPVIAPLADVVFRRDPLATMVKDRIVAHIVRGT